MRSEGKERYSELSRRSGFIDRFNEWGVIPAPFPDGSCRDNTVYPSADAQDNVFPKQILKSRTAFKFNGVVAEAFGQCRIT